MARWIRAVFDNAMVHVAGASLYPLLEVEIRTRGHELTALPGNLGPNPKDISEWGIDIGGPAHTIPSEDVGILLRTLKACERREFTGWRPLQANGDQSGYRVPYFKLKASSALVLTPTQYNSLRAQMVSRANSAEKRAKDHHDSIIMEES